MNYREQREKLGLSQSEVAKMAGISLMAYQNIERGVTREPKAENLKRILEVLKMKEKQE